MKVTIECFTHNKEIILKYFCWRYKVEGVKKVICSFDKSVFPFIFFELGDVVIDLKCKEDYEISYDLDILVHDTINEKVAHCIDLGPS